MSAKLSNAWFANKQKVKPYMEKPLIAYIDGSYSDAKKKYAFGAVILTPDGSIIEESGSNNNESALENWNVAGELLGAMFVTRWAVNQKYKTLIIRYDYEGIAKWAEKSWKAKSFSAKQYVSYMDKMRQHIEIIFEKVTAHSGDKYNDMADKLAKQALEIG